jgi:hypothetical protein
MESSRIFFVLEPPLRGKIRDFPFSKPIFLQSNKPKSRTLDDLYLKSKTSDKKNHET